MPLRCADGDHTVAAAGAFIFVVVDDAGFRIFFSADTGQAGKRS